MQLRLPFFFCLVLGQLAFCQTVTPDLTFGTNGKVVAPLGATTYSIGSVGFLSGGNFLALCTAFDGEYAPVVVKYNNDGTVDSTFGTNGVVSVGNNIKLSGNLAVLSDGSFLVCGSFRPGLTFYRTILLKYHADGTLDTTFGTNGVLSVYEGGRKSSPRLAVDNNGKILLVGSHYNAIDFQGDFWVKRLNANGTVDTAFGNAGELIIDFGQDESPTSIAFQSDNKIILTGHSEQPVGPDNSNFALARINTDGTLDSGFGTNGKITTDFGGNDIALSVAVMGNGDIILAGYSAYNNDANAKIAVAKYDLSGIPDTGFGNNGRLLSIINPTAQYDILTKIIAKDNKIYGVGVSKNTNIDYLLVRYNLDGSLDTSLNPQGFIITDFNGTNDFAMNAELQPDGKLLCMGNTKSATPILNPSMARFEFGTLAAPAFEKGLFSVYPNPFSKTISIAVNTPISVNMQAELYDSLGRNIGAYIQNEGAVVRVAPSGFIAEGCYFLKITASGQSQVFKVLKQ